MARVFEADLSLAGMRKLKKELTHYRRVVLTECLNNFVSDLAELGIEVAMENVGEPFGGYIGFKKEVMDTKYNYKKKAIVYGVNLIDFVSTWYRGTEEVSEVVNALLMAEYGSGKFADSKHRGTFPNQTHAFESVWRWSEVPFWNATNADWIYSSGYKPTMPMYNALVEMKSQVSRVAERAFMRTQT